MISSYKFKIILWYTSLLSAILIGVFILIYTILGYQLQHEINCKIIKKAEWMNSVLREIDNPPENKNHFFNMIPLRKHSRHPDFYDIREYTDIADHKFILFVFRDNSLMYLTKRYKKYLTFINDFPVEEMSVFTKQLKTTPFSLIKIDKGGYSVFLGYQLSTVNSVKTKILQLFIAVLPIGILFSILCGYFVTQRSLNIINRINKTAKDITSKNLHHRINVPKGKDEIRDLILTLNSMINRLEESFTTVRQFSQDAAHEIRTPLTIIRGEIEELLTYERCPKNISTTLVSILEEIQYLISISNKLMLIHSIDSGNIDYDLSEINLSKIIEETFEDAKVLSSEKNQKIELLQNDKIKLKGNEELLTRLLWNLIDNSVKYTPKGGKISIELTQLRDKGILTIQDNGIGIPKEDIPGIFERFYRVDKSRSRRLSSSGLGLAICKWIVELHQGDIRVESKINKGTKFVISFPLT